MRAKRPAAAAILLTLALAALPARSALEFGDHFLWAQLKYDGGWDPYPGVYAEILSFMNTTTAIAPVAERKVLDLMDPELFSAPFLVLAGRGPVTDLSDEQLRRLRSYITSGGFLWIEDAGAQRSSPFDRWVRKTLKAAVPEADLKPIGPDHAVYRSFFLLKNPYGRSAAFSNMEGLNWGTKTVVIYSRNDLLGAWAKDNLGAPLLPCVPGGEAQRMNAKKVTGNIIMFALTGTYKLDAVHQPFILQKLRQAPLPQVPN